MLRPGELLKLRHADVSLPGDFTLSHPFAALRIACPKHRRQFGLEQFVVLRNPNTICGLRQCLVEGDPRTLWDSQPAVFAKFFKQICSELKISSCGFTPASLRPGGAIMLFGQGISISTLRFMGRWIVERSLEHYIQLAVSTQTVNKLPVDAISRLKKVGHLCLEHVLFRDSSAIWQPPEAAQAHSASALVECCNSYAALEGKAR